jgi:hypothetical protein
MQCNARGWHMPSQSMGTMGAPGGTAARMSELYPDKSKHLGLGYG